MTGFSRFNQRWAANGGIDPITDNNANIGLGFLGDDPPTVELHNQMFQWLDEKDNYLFTQVKNAIVDRLGQVPTESDLTTLAKAVSAPSTLTFAGVQRNSTTDETTALTSAVRTVTPASLQPLIASLQLSISRAVPSGAVMPFAMSSAPAGWIPCDGRSVSRVDYPLLFAAIGVTYGSVDSSTFNVPYMLGLFPRAWNGSTSGDDANRVFGSKQTDGFKAHTHVATIAALPAHTHTFTTATAGAHTHPMTISTDGAHVHAASSDTQGSHAHTITVDANGSHQHDGYTNLDGSHAHAITTASNTAYTPGTIAAGGTNPGGFANGATQAAGVHQHYFLTNAGGYHTHTASAAVAGAHAHNITIASAGAHTHTLGMTTAGDHTHTGTTAAAGGVTPLATVAETGITETRPVNIALNYCIKT